MKYTRHLSRFITMLLILGNSAMGPDDYPKSVSDQEKNNPNRAVSVRGGTGSIGTEQLAALRRRGVRQLEVPPQDQDQDQGTEQIDGPEASNYQVVPSRDRLVNGQRGQDRRQPEDQYAAPSPTAPQDYNEVPLSIRQRNARQSRDGASTDDQFGPPSSRPADDANYQVVPSRDRLPNGRSAETHYQDITWDEARSEYFQAPPPQGEVGVDFEQMQRPQYQSPADYELSAQDDNYQDLSLSPDEPGNYFLPSPRANYELSARAETSAPQTPRLTIGLLRDLKTYARLEKEFRSYKGNKDKADSKERLVNAAKDAIERNHKFAIRRAPTSRELKELENSFYHFSVDHSHRAERRILATFQDRSKLPVQTRDGRREEAVEVEGHQ